MEGIEVLVRYTYDEKYGINVANSGDMGTVGRAQRQLFYITQTLNGRKEDGTKATRRPRR